MPQFVKNWWDTPPPNFSTNGSWGWYYFVGMPLQILGPALCK
jgi:hypothetical protein